jgi:hypothetical protein
MQPRNQNSTAELEDSPLATPPVAFPQSDLPSA